MKKIIGKMDFDEEFIKKVDKAKAILGIRFESVPKIIKEICKIAIAQRKYLRSTIEILFDFVQEYHPEYEKSEKAKDILKIYYKYFKSKSQ